MIAIFAALSAILAALGLYGVVAHAVSQQRREIGIRMALGASAGRIRMEVLREGSLLAVAGLALGLAGAGLLARALRSLLYEIGPYHLPTYALVALGLGIVALASCAIPAWRASREDAAVALRAD